jgi:hypothetical protein
MRERSHEKGRMQLMGFLRLMTTFEAKYPITEIGNAYTTSARTHITGVDPAEEIYYDAVLGIKTTPDSNTSCYIESKAAHSNSFKKLRNHLEDFLLKSYRALRVWKDDKKKHKPLFLFVTNVRFSSTLIKNGALDRCELAKLIAKKKGKITYKQMSYLCDNFVLFIYNNWLQTLVR